RAGEAAAEGSVVEGGELDQHRRRQLGPGCERRLARFLGELVPRAGGEAVVAAIDAIAEQWPELGIDRALVLDGEIGDAAPRIDLVGLGERVGRTGVEAGAALAAVIGLG